MRRVVRFLCLLILLPGTCACNSSHVSDTEPDTQGIYSTAASSEGPSFSVSGEADDETKVYTTADVYEEGAANAPAASVDVNFPGLYQVGNAMAAITVTRLMGISYETIAETLSHIHVPGRLDMVYQSTRFSVCVDFAHNGYSTRNLLVSLRRFLPKRLVCVFSADGNRALSRRFEMGEACGRLADLSIVTSGHNRYETFERSCLSRLRRKTSRASWI